MQIEKLKPGDVVYDVHSYTMGNTRLRSVGVWEVKIVSVDLVNQIVQASWNSNPVEKFRVNSWKKWRLKKPTLCKNRIGQYFFQKHERST